MHMQHQMVLITMLDFCYIVLLYFLNCFAASTMRAFRQVGEKQLPNPVLCMAWSPKRDLIALANTSGEVGLKSHFPYD